MRWEVSKRPAQGFGPDICTADSEIYGEMLLRLDARNGVLVIESDLGVHVLDTEAIFDDFHDTADRELTSHLPARGMDRG